MARRLAGRVITAALFELGKFLIGLYIGKQAWNLRLARRHPSSWF